MLEKQYPSTGIVSQGSTNKDTFYLYLAKLEINGVTYNNTTNYEVKNIKLTTGLANNGLVNVVSRMYNGLNSGSYNLSPSIALSYGFISLDLSYSTMGSVSSDAITVPASRDSNALVAPFKSDFYMNNQNHYSAIQTSYKQYSSHQKGYTNFHTRVNYTVTNAFAGVTYTGQLELVQLMNINIQ